MSLYQLAFRHVSVSKNGLVENFRESNERLEFLGDAILGMVVAEYLFRKYPYKNEGFLTELRSKIVNRDSLNSIARKIGIDQLIEFDGNRVSNHRSSIYGDAMEALIGAMLLDHGFNFTKRYICDNLLVNYFDLEKLINTTVNYKSLILSWSQIEQKSIEFVTVGSNDLKQNKQFKVELLIDKEVFSDGNGWNKKKAEQDAARRACLKLDIDHSLFS